VALSHVKNRVLIRVASLALFFATATNVQASKEPCNQSLIDRMPLRPLPIFIRASHTAVLSMENNYGYCGEVSLMEAALANGEGYRNTTPDSSAAPD